jgi:hypothetical protein
MARPSPAPAPRLRLITVQYTLRNGARGTLPCIAHHTADAICMALDTYGEQLRTCSARTPTPPAA